MNAAEKHQLPSWLRRIGVLACSVVFFAACKPSAKIDAGPQTALGAVAASVTAELLAGKGAVVLLVNAEDQKPNTAIGKAVEAFREALKQTGVEVQAVEEFPALSAPLLSGMEPVPADKFVEAVKKHATADAIVSFVGAPRFNAQQIAELPNPRPKIIAAVTFNPPARAMFAAGVLHAAIIARSGGPSAAPSAGTQEQFDTNYQMIRADNVNLLPW